ncbi:MAG TPA: hypothetical protein VF755_20850 [Catenuloplanes sp.]|jgi:hypothetical protein
MTAATVVVIVAATAMTLGVGRPFRMGNASPAAHGIAAASAPAAAEPAPLADPKRVPATPEAVLELLTQLVRPIKTSNEAKSGDGGLLVQAYLNDADKGPGMIRLGVRSAPPAGGGAGAAPPPRCRPSTEPQRICQTLPNGAKVSIVTVPDNCAQRIAVSVIHPDGIGVAIDIASCLEFDGTTNPAGRIALTADQAVAIAADPRWQRTTDPDLVAAGKRHFPALRRTALPDVGEIPTSQPVGAGSTTGAAAVTDGALQWEDVNGDSADDYCRRVGQDNVRTGRVACTLSTKDGFGRTVTSPVLDWGPRAGRDWEDFNGDNRADFCRRIGEPDGATGRIACTLSTGTGFGQTLTSPVLDLGPETGWAWDDANNDNTADYCRRLSPGGASGRVACTLSTGTGFGDTIVSPELDLGSAVGFEWEDVNGDNKTDYCRRLSPGDGATGKVGCTLSTGAGFDDAITSPKLDLGAQTGAAWEDINGDDKADYCRRLSPRDGASGRVACTLSTGTGFGQTLTSAETDLGPDDAAATWEDVNGDDRTDYCRRVGGPRGNTQVSCTLSTGTGFGATITSSILDWGQDAGVHWVDVNADQRKDYCRRTGTKNEADSRLSCTLSTGTGFGDTVQSPVLDWGLDD